MKTRTRPTFRQFSLAGTFLLAFVGITVFLFTYRKDQQQFDNITSQLFRSEMSGNVLSMHYTLANPEEFGIYNYDAVLPTYSAEGRLKNQAKTENLLSLLHSISPSKLNDSDSYTHSLLVTALENSLTMNSYLYYDEPLSPSSGMQSQLPILLAEYTFRSKQDVEDYLELLDQTDEYFASLLVFEQEKAEAGLLMPAVSLEKVREQCHTILTIESLDAGSHFLQTTFKERLSALYEQGKITQEEAVYYVSQNDRLLRTVLTPAYEALSDGLFLLCDDSIKVAGLSSKPKGADYYQLLVYSETGSSRSVADIKNMLTQKFDEEYQTIAEIIAQNPALAVNSYKDAITDAFPCQSITHMLTDLQLRMQEDFPSFDSNEVLPNVTVKSVSENLQDYCAPAYYLTPPLDNTLENVIYINEKNSPTGLELYTTLAHEGYPGHLYQTVYSNRAMHAREDNYVRQLLWHGGYLEGWALYVEFISYDYASHIMTEQEESELALAVQLEKHNRSLQLCLYSLLDILIHYENASCDQIAQILSSLGITNASTVSTIYEYIVEEPANYLKYYLGYLEILSLRQEAVEYWGEGYSDMEFHTFYLESGPSDFTALSNRLYNTAAPRTQTRLELSYYSSYLLHSN